MNIATISPPPGDLHVNLGGRDSTPVRGVPYEPVVSSQAPEDCAFGNTIPEQGLSRNW